MVQSLVNPIISSLLTHRHHQMEYTEVKLIILFVEGWKSNNKDVTKGADCGTDHKFQVQLIWKKEDNRFLAYDLETIPIIFKESIKNRFETSLVMTYSKKGDIWYPSS